MEVHVLLLDCVEQIVVKGEIPCMRNVFFCQSFQKLSAADAAQSAPAGEKGIVVLEDWIFFSL